MHKNKLVASVLRALRDRHNVLVSGAPGTGKSRLLGEIARTFEARQPGETGPVVAPYAKVGIPANPASSPLQNWQPSASRKNRKVFTTVFHQNTKHRDFVSGLVPAVSEEGAALTFRVQIGKLIEAAEHAKTPDGASLLIIDEINRGPAVQIFGGAIVSMESDKRLNEDGGFKSTTQTFDYVDKEGSFGPFALPHHLYIVAAMNQADTSVEPLDVAFLRRWTPFDLHPDAPILHEHFGLPATLPEPPTKPESGLDVYGAVVSAWESVNRRIAIGRGPEFQLGHGVLMGPSPPTSAEDALRYIKPGWDIVRTHIDEVFYGDLRGVAETLNVSAAGHPITIQAHTFADQPRLELCGNNSVEGMDLYALLLAVSG